MADKMVNLFVGGGDSQSERMNGATVFAYSGFTAALANDGTTSVVPVKPLNLYGNGGPSALFQTVNEFGRYDAMIADDDTHVYLMSSHELWGAPLHVVPGSW